MHYIVGCSNDRTQFIEYKRFKGVKFEIQVRSILQHAWAEIEHDLGYKGEVSVPANFKRGFNRVAALLEAADLECDRLKIELTKYETDVKELIKNQPQNVKLDQASLLSFNQTNKILKKARSIVDVNTKCKFSYTTDFGSNLKCFKEIFKLT